MLCKDRVRNVILSFLMFVHVVFKERTLPFDRLLAQPEAVKALSVPVAEPQPQQDCQPHQALTKQGPSPTSPLICLESSSS